MNHEYKPRRPRAAPVDPNRCKASVPGPPRSMRFYQCKRKPWKDGWCKQHHPDTVAERRAKNQKRYEQKHQRSPMAQLRRANEEIVRLKARVAELEAEIAESGVVTPAQGRRNLLDMAVELKRAEQASRDARRGEEAPNAG